VVLFGKVELDRASGEISMHHPEFEILAGDDDGEGSLGRVVPIYEGVGKLTTQVLRSIMHRVLEIAEPEEDGLPQHLRRQLNLPDRWTALCETHFPSADTDLRLLNAFRSQAQFRLIFEEFFWLECENGLKHTLARTRTGIAFSLSEHVRERIKAMLAMLPFKPTNAQKHVLGEIGQDMVSPHPMNRLLQGDAGSGRRGRADRHRKRLSGGHARTR
jgi:ATP-dependent DNA helicase RecG